MKYLKVEGGGRLRLRGSAIGLGSTSRKQGEEGISSPICTIPISDPTGEAEAMTDLRSDWRWPMLLEFEMEAEAMSSVSPFLISVFATIQRRWNTGGVFLDMFLLGLMVVLVEGSVTSSPRCCRVWLVEYWGWSSSSSRVPLLGIFWALENRSTVSESAIFPPSRGVPCL